MGQRYVLIGPHAGKTMTVNGHQFVDGAFEAHVGEDKVGMLTRVLSFYGAVTEAEAELLALRAQAAKPVVQAEGGEVVLTAAITEVVGSATVADVPKAPAGDVKPTLGEAVGMLDPEDPTHWTSNNLPSLDYLSTLTGTKVARGDVEDVADGYTRAKARAAKQ